MTHESEHEIFAYSLAPGSCSVPCLKKTKKEIIHLCFS